MEDNQNIEQLNQLLEEAKSSLSQIRSNKTQIANRLQEIETFYTQFQGVRGQVNDGNEGVSAVFEKAKSLKQEIDQLKDASQTKLTEIETQLSSVTSKVQEIETFYTQFQGVRDQVNDGNEGVSAVFEKAKSLKQEIDQLKDASQTKLTEIETQLSSVTSKVQEIEAFYTQFVELKDKIEDEEGGLEAILGQASDLKNKISQKNKSAEDTLLAIKDLKTKSEELKKNAETDRGTIETYKTESEGFKKSIGEILDLVTPSSLRNEFKNREKEIKSTVKFWKWSLLAGLLLLSAAVLFIYDLQSTSTNGFADWKQWYRYLFTSPLVYLVYVCAKNYSMERDLLEKYAFKAVLSTSLRAYIKLLRDYFPEEKSQILDFTLDSTSKIYKEPYYDKDKRRKVMFGIKSIFNVGIEDEEIKKDFSIEKLLEREKAGIKKSTKSESTTTKTVTSK